MLSSLQEALAGKAGNYLLPFFWQHGEEEAVLRDYVRAIHASGCGAFCVESRPHPDYCGPGWWRDMDIILEEARARDMKVWILDDSHFPTGYANGALREADPSLCKQSLFFSRSDVCGPMPAATLDVTAVARYCNDIPNPLIGKRGYTARVFDDDTMLAVVAGRVGPRDKLVEIIDLTPQVTDGKLTWDVPKGMWKVYVLYLTRNAGGRTDYINVLDEKSCRAQLDAVYEPHFKHYKEDFGKTIAGFFSDEPLFGNIWGYVYDDRIGHKFMGIPWSAAVPAMLEERLGQSWMSCLPLLWTDSDDAGENARARQAYMDVVTALVEKNFSYQLGDWCRARGVEYIGHIIEDNDQHTHLGVTLGHFYRSMNGQDMAGIDNIGGQVLPGAEDMLRSPLFGAPGDGEFYHFVPGKLASSHAHIDPKKKNRAMCEIFGAYGWSLGVRDMKYLADHFLVRGVNRYVPHAFSPKAYPDPDCPPHFYAHGKNPQFRHFSTLMPYMNRVCHMMEGAVHAAPVALLYHAEAEWAGDYMPDKKPARALHENQIDFDILPPDLFAGSDSYYEPRFDGMLRVGGESFGALVIPYSQFLTKAVAAFIGESTAKGFPVFVVDALPEGISDTADKAEEQALLRGMGACEVVSLTELAAAIRQRVDCDFLAEPAFRRLRYYHCRNEGKDIYLVLNEDPGESFEGVVKLPVAGETVAYDPYVNETAPARCRAAGKDMEVALNLTPLALTILVVDPAKPAPGDFIPEIKFEKKILSASWALSLAKSEAYPSFEGKETLEKLESVALRHPNFSGFMRYDAAVTLDGAQSSAKFLELEDAYEGAELWVNGVNAGIRIAKPYRFPVAGLFREGENQIRIEVANTLARENRAVIESAGQYANRATKILAPSGIVGEVYLGY